MLDRTDWNNYDTSDLLDGGNVVELEIIKYDIECTYCGSSRVRPRLVDMHGIKKVKVIYCRDCKKEKILLKICNCSKCANGAIVL